jgi:hypothetical protein
MSLTWCCWRRAVGQLAAGWPQRNVYGRRRSRLKPLLPLSIATQRPGHTKTNVQALSLAFPATRGCSGSSQTSARFEIVDSHLVAHRACAAVWEWGSPTWRNRVQGEAKRENARARCC